MLVHSFITITSISKMQNYYSFSYSSAKLLGHALCFYHTAVTIFIVPNLRGARRAMIRGRDKG